MTTLGAGARALALEATVDHNYLRLTLLLLTPVHIFFTLFFAQVIVGCLAQLFGSVKQLIINSNFYSATPPPRLQGAVLPHIIIKCPVYREPLKPVIAPTVKSIKQAMSTYENCKADRQMGSSMMMVGRLSRRRRERRGLTLC